MEWKLKDNAEPQGNSDDFWYGINEGYINPEEVLSDKEQIKILKDALDIINDFESTLKANDLIIEF
jgi:hypothetical protein